MLRSQLGSRQAPGPRVNMGLSGVSHQLLMANRKSTKIRPRPRPGKYREQRIYIREAAELLNRRMGTLRKWEQDGVLPKALLPHRGERGWRFWTPDQIEGIKEWIRNTNRYSGNAFPHYNPTEKELGKAINQMRRPHRTRQRLEEIT